jgi:DNA-directed RNA polymerase subunit RPC12/RpoP
MAKGLTRTQIVCRACGWKWYPDPHKWRNNLNTDVSERTLKCPRCGIPNHVGIKDVKKILKYN